MENLDGFITGAERITPEMGKGLKNLAEALLILTGTAMLNSLGILGRTSLATFGNQLKTFGTSLAEFMRTVSEPFRNLSDATDSEGNPKKVDFDAIESAMKVADRLVGIAQNMPDTSGVKTWWAKKDLGEFGTQIGNFADGLVAFLQGVSAPFETLSTGKVNAKNVTTIDFEAVEDSVDIAVKLVDIADSIPDNFGLGTIFGSSKNLGVFGHQIAVFASGLASYLVAMSDPIAALSEVKDLPDTSELNWTNIDKTTEMASDLADIASKIPDTSGWGTIFDGKKDLGAFGVQIANFTTGLCTYLAAMSDPVNNYSGLASWTNGGLGNNSTLSALDWTNVEKSVEIASDLAAVAEKVPDTSGWNTTFSGKKDLSAFGTQIANFATGLCSYLVKMSDPISSYSGLASWTNGGLGNNSTLSELNWTNIESAVGMASDLADVAAKVPETSAWGDVFSGTKNLGGFGNQIANFATGLCTFLVEMSNPIATFNNQVPEGMKGEQSTNITKINWTVIEDAIGIASSLADVAAKVPDTSWWAETFSGAPDLGGFGDDVSTFGSGLATFLTTVNSAFATLSSAGSGEGSSINMDSINSAVAVAVKLGELAKTVGDNSAGWDWLTGKDNLGDFSTNIESLASGLSTLSTSVSGEDYDASGVNKAVTQISRLVGIAERLGDGGDFGSLKVLAGWMDDLGASLARFHINTADVDATKFSTIASGLQALASINIKDSTTLQSFIDSLGSVGADGVDAFANAFSKKTTEVTTAVGKMLTTISDSVSKYTGLKTAFATIVSDVSAAVGSETIIAGFKSAGGDLVSGFAAGITANTFIAAAAAAAMASVALAAAKAVLRINSPSKVFMGVGNSVPEGFAMGIDQLGGMVVGSVKTMAKNALEGTRNAISRISEVVSSDIDAQPTIRPVLDLSEVSAGAGAISGMLGTPSVGVMANLGAISAGMNKRQNGTNNDVISAIKDLGKKIGKTSGDTYQVNGVTYDDGTNIANTVGSLVRAIKVERRI